MELTVDADAPGGSRQHPLHERTVALNQTMEFGASTFTIEEMIEPDYIDRFLLTGITSLEIGARPLFIDPSNTAQHRRLREHMARTGARIHSIHAGNTNRHTMSHPDAAIRKETLEQARTAARIVTALGGDVVVVHPGCRRDETDSATAYHDRIYTGARAVVRVVAAEGARVAFENANPNGFPTDPGDLMAIINEFPPAQAGACIDTGHANCTGTMLDLIAAARGRIISTHLHDNDGTSDQHLAPGEGTIDWDATMRAFHEAAYAGPWVFEFGVVGRPTFDMLPDAMKFLTQAWARALGR